MDIKIAIIDDLQQDYTSLQKKLLSWAGKKHRLFITYFSSPAAVLEAYESGKFDFDLLFLDIMMPTMNGMDLIRELQKSNPAILFILTSSYTNYAETGYSVYAFDFISKPVSKERLASAMERITNRLSTYHTSCFVCEADKLMLKIPFSDIVLFRSSGNYMEVHTVSGECRLVRATLKSVYESCPSYFVKVNRNTVVNMSFVSAFNHEMLTFTCTDKSVPLSKVSYDDVRSTFLKLN